MKQRYLRISCSTVEILLILATTVAARPTAERHHLSVSTPTVDTVGELDGVQPAPRKALQDTVWIADWSFDSGFPCTDVGWERVDNHILNDGMVHWEVTAAYDSVGGVTGNAAALGYSNNACCTQETGYDNDWYQAIRITYSGSGFLSFDYLVDSELGFDFLRVESDSACASFDRVDFDVDPVSNAASFRTVEFEVSGFDTGGRVDSLAVPDFGTTEIHCVYIVFFSDAGYSPCDGLQPTRLGEALVVDNIELMRVNEPVNEGFDGPLNAHLTYLNVQEVTPFGNWARVYLYITDNDVCTENRTCAWLWTDHLTPTLANDPSMDFGPDGYVIRNWLDDIIISPWVSLAGTPTATGTVLRFRRFPGNFFNQSRIVQNWAVRTKTTIDGQECATSRSVKLRSVSNWGHAFEWAELSGFNWQSFTFDMTHDIDPTAEAIQLRFRTSDWQKIAGVGPPASLVPGPGPYIDDIWIGRRVVSGPVISEGIDSRSQAQDAYPSEIHPGITPGTGEHFRPTTDRFGTVAFSPGMELGINETSPNLITGDSVYVEVLDARKAGGIVAVDWYGVIVSGPHAGKAPAPWTVGTNGFFAIPADSVRNASGVLLENFWFVDLDDFYFRGGDVLNYLWLAEDAQGGITSDPQGLTAPPVSVEEAQQATEGIFEVSFLPAINWDPAYLARIAADPHGNLEPTADELAASTQSHCILYTQMASTRRLAGQVSRTSFMYTLDRLGYAGHYDVYDHQGLGNTNNHLGGRATPQQAQGYNLIVYDAGASGPTGWLMPDGTDLDLQKIDQAGWFRTWLSQASLSEAGFATLWVLGANILEERPDHPLFVTDMAVSLNGSTQRADQNPIVQSDASFTFQQGGGVTSTADFVGDEYVLSGGCPVPRDYDALGASAHSVETHSYRDPRSGQAVNAGAIVMRGNAAEAWNTILQSHPWFDFAQNPDAAPSSPTPQYVLMQKILGCVLPLSCLQSPSATDAPDAEELAAPQNTALYQNAPNPFNPTTTIRFDLATEGPVSLRIYDVAGRLVRNLLDEHRKAGARQSMIWDGRDAAGHRLANGVYFYRLEASGESFTRKLVVIK